MREASLPKASAVADPVELLMERLEGVQPSGGGWSALCPAHDDRKQSLSLARGDDGRALVRCHAGCTVDEIVAAIGLRPRDLFVAYRLGGKEAVQKRIAAKYDYRDGDGILLFQVVRYEPKDFRQRRPDGTGGWIWSLDGTPRVLYRQPEVVEAVRQGRTIFVVEGEKDVDTLVKLGRVATTNPGGAGKWREHYSRALRGARVAVIPDNDRAGWSHALGVAESLIGEAKSVRLVELPTARPHGDVSDWLGEGGTAQQLRALYRSAPRCTAKLLRALKKRDVADSKDGHSENSEYQKSDFLSWPEPLALDDSEVPAFPVDALPKWLSDYVVAEAVATQTPADLPAVLSLALIGAAVAKKIEVEARSGWVEAVNLYAVIALPPANRKSSVFADLSRPLKDYEAEEIALATPVVREAESQLRILQAGLKRAEEGAAKAWNTERGAVCRRQAAELSRKLSDLVVPAMPRVLVDDATPERLEVLLAEQGGRLALLSPEGEAFEMMAGRYAKNGTANLGVYLMAHSGDDLRVDRMGRAPVIVSRPSLSICLTVQPHVLSGLGEKPGFRGRGLLARFLFSVPHSLVGHRVCNPPAVPFGVALGYVVGMQKLLRFRTLRREMSASVLQLHPDAEQCLEEFAVWLEPQLGPGESLDTLADWAGKLVGQVVRLAGILHLAKWAQEDTPLERAIDAQTVRKAIQIGQYFLAHAKVAFGMMGADPNVTGAKRILAWVSRRGASHFSKREVHQGLRGSFRSAKDLDPCLLILSECGYIRETAAPRQSGPGRTPGPMYEVHPGVTDTQRRGRAARRAS